MTATNQPNRGDDRTAETTGLQPESVPKPHASFMVTGHLRTVSRGLAGSIRTRRSQPRTGAVTAYDATTVRMVRHPDGHGVAESVPTARSTTARTDDSGQLFPVRRPVGTDSGPAPDREVPAGRYTRALVALSTIHTAEPTVSMASVPILTTSEANPDSRRSAGEYHVHRSGPASSGPGSITRDETRAK